MLLSRKGQEEIVGFVAIVLLISIIGVVFLGMMINNDNPTIKESKDVKRLIDGSMRFTSDCAIEWVPQYQTLGDLIQVCYQDSRKECVSGEKICSALNRTLLEMLDGTIKTGDQYKNKGYIFKTIITMNISSNNGTEILKVLKGNCTAQEFIEGYNSFQGKNGETFISTLRICY